MKLSADPQNKNWSTDKSKFGFQMLLKMGWTEGKGLGAKEDGAVAHVKTKVNVENRGVGCDAKTANNWLANTHGFSDVLSRLNAAYSSPKADADSDSDDAEPEPKPAPKKALPRHLIYQKRHRNKNVSAYGKKDLDAILGGTRSRAAAAAGSDSDAEEPAASGTDAFLRHSGRSIDDYFAGRQAARDDADEDEPSADERPGLGLSGPSPRAAPVPAADEAAKPKSSKKSKKKQQEASGDEDDATEEPRRAKESKRRRRDEPAAEEAPADEDEQTKSKKKRRAAEAEADTQQAEEAAAGGKRRKSKSKAVADDELEAAAAAEPRKRKSRRDDAEEAAAEAVEEEATPRVKKGKRSKTPRADMSPKRD